MSPLPTPPSLVASPGPRPRSASPAPAHGPSSALPVLAAGFSLAWLLAGNLVGLLLAALLLWPKLGDAFTPFTYGRWMPVHHNAQLYGWCALPLVGLLLRAFLVPGRAGDRHALLALGAWSAALGFGCVSWLRGQASGKLFLDWAGPARVVFPAALCVLWAVLAHHATLRLAGEAASSAQPPDVVPGPARRALPPAAGRPPQLPHLLRFALVAGLLFVPLVLHYSAGPRSFPPVNPHSGGATGVSLYGSTLGLLVVFAAVPWLVALPLRPGARASRLIWPALGLAGAVFVGSNHSPGSHHDLDQIITLGLLFFAPPLLAHAWGRYVWKPEARRWLVAALGWGTLLVVDGWVTFLPGFSERLKFTNALVAHSHLAMAGLLTSLNAVFLLHLGAVSRVEAALGARRPFWLWQGAAAAHIGALLALGWFEGAEPALVLGGGTALRLTYAVRLVAGGAMTVASVEWLWAVCRRAAGAPQTVACWIGSPPPAAANPVSSGNR